MSDAAFGPAIDGSDVEAALLAHLELWMPTHLPAMMRRKDPGKTLWPNGVKREITYSVKHAANEKWPEDQLPMLLAYSPGMSADPHMRGDGLMDADYVCVLTAIASGVDIADTKALARLYSSAAREAVLQHPALGDFAAQVRMHAERNFPITRGVEAERNLMGVSVPFTISVEGILNRDSGVREPLEDPDTPPPDAPVVKEPSVEAGLGELLS
jgi:hypothetical protein